jgi:arabinan endo-1,5-alpha-L-arabinosidase
LKGARGSRSTQVARREFVGGVLLAAAGLGRAAADPGSINARMQGDFAPVHDPCIIRQGETYYVFSTSVKTDTAGFIACRRSRRSRNLGARRVRLRSDSRMGARSGASHQGNLGSRYLFFNGLYHLYYSVSSFGSNHSVIGLATNKTLDRKAPGFEWVDRGLVIQSRMHDRFNAIDPNLCVDREGRHWLSWGSFWDGIKMARIDPATGKRLDTAELISLASRPAPRGEPSPIEAPFVIARGDYYYLFASFDFCCRGAKSTYFVVCGRSKEVTGPYIDVNGRAMLEGGGSIVIQGDARFKAPVTARTCARASATTSSITPMTPSMPGTPTLRISPIYWTPDGWPRAQL